MTKMLLINQLKAMRINHSSKIVCLTLTTIKESDFLGSYWVNDDDNFDKYKRADSEALEKGRKLLEGDKCSKGYFAVNLNIDAFKSLIYLLSVPGYQHQT